MAEGLRSVQEVPGPYRCFFNAYPFFNRIQSCVMDDVLHSDKPVVVSAPTGSGKTAILELALVRLLSAATHTGEHGRRPRAVYVSPLKALCRERLCEWRTKLASLDVSCAEYTGDTNDDHDQEALLGAQLLLTTPACSLLAPKITSSFSYILGPRYMPAALLWPYIQGFKMHQAIN
ncbi:putative ATP-dependent DNA helicase HFM1 [Rhipicephalus microplus]|uniref:putative ATP-dependent DNA helicase HFM1 n=1 Tax=Rhipicephalus microplus TaxID=6941 RepID=UPI003F6B4A00